MACLTYPSFLMCNRVSLTLSVEIFLVLLFPVMFSMEMKTSAVILFLREEAHSLLKLVSSHITFPLVFFLSLEPFPRVLPEMEFPNDLVNSN